MQLVFYCAIAIVASVIFSCKKDKDCESTTATVVFNNTSPEDLWVEISRLGELDPEFREVDKTFAIPSYGNREEELPAGIRFIRWARCEAGPRCTELSIREASYQACEEYTEQPVR